MEKKQIEYLDGPVSWYEFIFTDDNGNQKIIHLFGDEHELGGQCDKKLKCMKSSKDEKSNCYDFLYFLQELFDEVKSKNLYADFFIEIPYIFPSKKDIYQNINVTNVISKIYNKFGSCIKRNKKDCVYNPNIRMHFTDIRTIRFPEENDVNEQFLAMLTGQKSQNTDPINSFFDLSKYMILDFLSGIIDTILEMNAIKVMINNTPKIIAPNIQQIDPVFYQVQSQELSSRQNMIKIFFMMFENICELMDIIITSSNYVQDLDNFLAPYIKILSQSDIFIPKDIKEFNKIANRLKKFKHPKTQYSVVGQQLAELEKDKVMVKGQNIATLIKNYILNSCREYLSKNKVVENLSAKFDDFLNEIFEQSEEGMSFRNNLDIRSQSIQSDKDIKKHFSEVEKQVKKIFQMYNNFATFYDDVIILVESRLLDGFILSRLFRTFSSSKKPHVPSILSIIYAGDIHTVFQVEFFEKYLGLKPVHRIDNEEGPKRRADYQCLYGKDLGKIFDL